MQTETVSVLSVAGMLVSLLISIGLPIGLAVWLRKKKRAELSPLLVGSAVFIMFAMTLEQVLHTIVFSSPAGEVLMNNIVLYGLYGGLAAALFEEAGRFLAMKRFMKGQISRENALMYGVGHGGTEAILLIGMGYINNLITATMINKGELETLLASVPEEQRDAALQNVSQLWTTPSYQFFMSGLERVFAIALQIALSVMIYMAVKQGEKKYIAMAFGAHFVVDFVSVVVSKTLPVWAVELVVLVMTALVVYIAYRLYREDEKSDGAASEFAGKR